MSDPFIGVFVAFVRFPRYGSRIFVSSSRFSFISKSIIPSLQACIFSLNSHFRYYGNYEGGFELRLEIASISK